MPPAASGRKGSITADSNRRVSGRQARTSTSRPINYYARPYGSLSGPVDEPQDQDPPGFFPAITYFADAITQLPKEVQRHVSLMKEVEAKVYGPTEALKRLSADILQLPIPPPRNPEPFSQGLLSFTANNSTTASLNGSVINGVAPNVDGFSDVLDAANSHIDEQADIARRTQFRDLRHLIGNMIVNLDEKNNVMAEANRILAQQLNRMTSVMPHVENEISEEARLGSLTHWAYADNRAKKLAPPTNERRRDVAATSNLAAAAAAVHDNDIAAARGQATREGKKARNNHVDSDFDDRAAPKRAAPGKARKEAAEQKATGLGITNGAGGAAPAKRRKVEKLAAPAMERSASGVKNAKAGNTTPRSTPQAEPVKQRKKPGPAPGFIPVKKRNQAVASGANSPAVNSSPVLAPVLPDLSASRPTTARGRQNSGTSNLQYSLLAGGDKKANSRPVSAAENRSINGANGNGEAHAPAESKNKAQEVDQDKMNIDPEPKLDRTQTLKHEDTAMSDASSDQPARGRTTKTSAPLIAAAEGGTSMLRTRSNRGVNPRISDINNANSTNSDADKNGTTLSTRTSQSQTPEAGAVGGAAAGGGGGDNPKRNRHHHSSHHRKSGSGAHILKQIASFNRSPDMDRHSSVPGDPTSDVDSEGDQDEEARHSRNQVRGPSSRRRARDSGSVSGRGSVSGDNEGGVRSSSRRSVAPRTVVSNSAAGMQERGGRSSRASRTRGGDTIEPRSAPHSLSRQHTPEVQEAPPAMIPDDEEDEQSDEPVEELGVEGEVEEEEEVAVAAREPEIHQADEDEEDEEEEEEEDPNEPKYCYCGQGSFGEMIACDNESCSMEWFHLQCTGLRSVPGDNVKWYCDVCKESMGTRGRKGRPGSRHAGH